jgi:PqqD family protein of HPr-rel-A system
VKPEATSPIWKITEGCTLLWRTWDEESVILNTGSGFTHVLDATSASVLRSLQDAAATTDQLAERLATRLDSPVPYSELAGYLENLLYRLEDLGLAECTRPQC